MPEPVSPPPGCPPVIVEVIALSESDGSLRYRVRRAALDEGLHPDDLAIRLSGLSLCTPGALLHSTSWRYDTGTLVLTYAALPDPNPDQAAAQVAADAMVIARNPLVPSPPRIDVDAVAAHACRHLALLVTTDPVVADAATYLPQLWQLIAKLPAGCAGGLQPSLGRSSIAPC